MLPRTSGLYDAQRKVAEGRDHIDPPLPRAAPPRPDYSGARQYVRALDLVADPELAVQQRSEQAYQLLHDLAAEYVLKQWTDNMSFKNRIKQRRGYKPGIAGDAGIYRNAGRPPSYLSNRPTGSSTQRPKGQRRIQRKSVIIGLDTT